MSLKKEESGRRSISVEVEVPGTPEEVWQAIATGPGVSSWFAAMEIEEREGGQLTMDMGGGPVPIGKVTEWDPPRRFVGEGHSFGPEAPPVATEWIVEARSGGACVVRVVHSLFASTDDWDDQLESIENGWPRFFKVLRTYMTHFRGEPCSIISVMQGVDGPETEAWQALTTGLGVAGKSSGQPWTTPSGVPSLSGVVEHSIDAEQPHGLLLIDEPTPGIASPFVFPMGDQWMANLNLYLYGDTARAIADRDQPLWQAWLETTRP